MGSKVGVQRLSSLTGLYLFLSLLRLLYTSPLHISSVLRESFSITTITVQKLLILIYPLMSVARESFK